MAAAHARTGSVKRWRQALETVLLRAAVACVPRLPRSLAHRGAAAAARLAWAIDSRGRRTSMENLEVVYGDRLRRSQKRAIALGAYRNLGVTMVDLLWGRNLTAENYRRFVDITFADEPATRAALDSGAICITPHFGNFEWMAYVMGLTGRNACIIMEDFKNPALTPIFRNLRSRTGNTFIPQENAMIRLYRHLRKGGNVALLADLRVSPKEPSVIIDCFGLATSVTVLPAYLARKLGKPLVPCVCIPRPDGTCELRFFAPRTFDPDTSLEAISRYCWEVFEPVIREHPEHWIWMYKHWRYLPENPRRPYPSYARLNRHFTELERRMRNESASGPS